RGHAGGAPPMMSPQAPGAMLADGHEAPREGRPPRPAASARHPNRGRGVVQDRRAKATAVPFLVVVPRRRPRAPLAIFSVAGGNDGKFGVGNHVVSDLTPPRLHSRPRSAAAAAL